MKNNVKETTRLLLVLSNIILFVHLHVFYIVPLQKPSPIICNIYSPHFLLYTSFCIKCMLLMVPRVDNDSHFTYF